MPSAEYMRAYRAARRTPLQPRACERCGVEFTPRRSDARYCGSTCRSQASLNRDLGWIHDGQGRTCSFIDEETACKEPATWEHRFRWGGVPHHSFRCDEHAYG